MEENKTISRFKVASFKEILNPYISSKDEALARPRMYIAICDVMDIPSDFPMETNPRGQNLNTKVSKKIKDSLLGTDNEFYLLNRGILLSAKAVSYNAYSRELEIDFGAMGDSETPVYGNVDGGHTYNVILKNRDSLTSQSPQYVKLEILTGIEDFFEDLAEARNTSTQVKDSSISNLQGYFERIKRTVAGQPYADNISYKENEEGAISINEITAILNMFNIDRYPVSDEKNYPTVSYNGNAQCLQYYIEAHEKFTGDSLPMNPYEKMLPIMNDIFHLYDKLELNVQNYYKQAFPNGKYGSVKGVVVAKDGKPLYRSKFLGEPMSYSTAKGFIFPMLAAMRAFVTEKDMKYYWELDPFKMMDELGPTLIETVVRGSRDAGNNPNAVGKNIQIWKTLYQSAFIQKLKAMMSR